MKLESALNIDIIDDEQPPPAPPVIAKDAKEDLLRDVPLEGDSDDDLNSTINMDVPGMVEFVPKPKPSKDDIFDENTDNISISIEDPKPPPQVKKMKEDILPEPVVNNDPPKKQRKKRKPMSEEHLAKLALAREKALAKRQFLAEERRLKREQDKLIKDQEDILAQRETQKQLDVLQRKLKKSKVKKPVLDSSSEEEEQPAPRPKKDKQPVPSHFTMDDLQNAQLNAIMGYEAVRKKRKEEKKKSQNVNKQKKDIMDTIAQAKPSWYVDDSPFNGLF